jgi:hypothetical protein
MKPDTGPDREEFLAEDDEAMLTEEVSDEEIEAFLNKQKLEGYARRADGYYKDSTDYLDSSIRKHWERNLHHFNNQHAPGSKYHSEAYKGRSKQFRPKSRSASIAHSASLAAALFTNNDVVNINAQNKNDKFAEAGARVCKELVQYRLEETIPWFVTCIGAYQDTDNYGVCISKTTWKYAARERAELIPEYDLNGMPVVDEETGLFMGREVIHTDIEYDQPDITILPPENFRFDPNADWRDPVSDSPYLIELMPMYAQDVMDMAEQGWHKHSLGTILSHGAGDVENESTRQAREGQSQADPQNTITGDKNSIVWVRFNIIKEDGEDIAFFTVGGRLMLTDPVPLEEYLPLGRETYRVGFSTVEAHKNYPAGRTQLASSLQEELNDVVNQRMDNVKLVLNKRYFIRRQGNVNLKSLMRNVPGGGIMVEDPNNDVRVIDTNDVTSSSYAEQDRLSVETDELLGTFSQSSVQSNRKLNETVGGMDLMSSGANAVQELGIRVFIETWVEPVLRSLVKLEQMFETDETLMALVADKAQLLTRYGIDTVTDDLLNQNLVVRVNVGMGNTSPTQRIQKLSLGIQTVMQFPELAQKLDTNEINKEVWSSLGYSDGERFLISQDEGQPQDPNAQAGAEEAQKQQDQIDLGYYKADKDFEAKMARIAADQNIKLTELYERLGLDREKLATERQKVAVVEGNKINEMNLKREMGQGI